MDAVPYLDDGQVALVALSEEHLPTLTRWINDQAVLHYIDLHGGFSRSRSGSGSSGSAAAVPTTFSASCARPMDGWWVMWD